MSLCKDDLRVNDRVRIINPIVFVRCGYPLTKEVVKSIYITKEQKEAITTILNKSFGLNVSPSLISQDPKADDNIIYSEAYYMGNLAYTQIMDVMAGIVIQRKGWGGKERKIYTKEYPELLNATGRVLNKNIVKTGEYDAGKGYYSHSTYGEVDYDPPSLKNALSHVILDIWIDDNEKIPVGGQVQIEKCHVHKIANV